jgi:DNA-binding NarL/FixJ family response regulator
VKQGTNTLGKNISKKEATSLSPQILIVEDHQGVRQSLREWLELSFPRYQLLEATNGETGVTLAQAMNPCLVIMDIGLPGMSGIEAAQSIKAAVPATRVVMLTMFDDEAHRADAVAAGVSAYVTKREVQTKLLPVLTGFLEEDDSG